MIKGFMLYPGDYQYDVIVNYNHENINHWEEQKLLKYIESKGLLNKFIEYEHITYEELIETVLSQYELETDKIYYQRINQILSNDLIKRIDILNEMIIYEINSLRSSKIRQEELEKLLNDEPVNPTDDKPISEKDIDDFLQYIKDECAIGNISKKQIDNWKVKAKDLLNEREIHDTLRKWGEIDRKLSKVSNIGLLFNIAKANEGKIKVKFKGNIQIKTTPENHQKISLAAEKSSMDINSWINKVLTNAVEKSVDS
jgi:hypothetical protein